MKGKVMIVTIVPGVTKIAVIGLLPGQTVQVSAANQLGFSKPTAYTAQAPLSEPDAPEVTD